MNEQQKARIVELAKDAEGLLETRRNARASFHRHFFADQVRKASAEAFRIVCEAAGLKT